MLAPHHQRNWTVEVDIPQQGVGGRIEGHRGISRSASRSRTALESPTASGTVKSAPREARDDVGLKTSVVGIGYGDATGPGGVGGAKHGTKVARLLDRLRQRAATPALVAPIAPGPLGTGGPPPAAPSGFCR